jgi:Na+/pantothenate symporter
VLRQPHTVSQRLRVICVLMSLAGLGLSAVFFAKIIQAIVWENAQDWAYWCAVYVGVYISLALLFLVVRDYQKFVYGMPNLTLPDKQSGS